MCTGSEHQHELAQDGKRLPCPVSGPAIKHQRNLSSPGEVLMGEADEQMLRDATNIDDCVPPYRTSNWHKPYLNRKLMHFFTHNCIKLLLTEVEQ